MYLYQILNIYQMFFYIKYIFIKYFLKYFFIRYVYDAKYIYI